MVHALRNVYDLLKEGGLLIDIHPIANPRRIEVWIDDEPNLIGTSEDTQRFATYRLADQALSQSVRRQLFTPLGRERFIFQVHVDTLSDLLDYFAEKEIVGGKRQQTVLEEPIRQRITSLYQTASGQKEIVFYRPTLISWFRKLLR